MNPVNHVLLFRSNIDIRNERIDESNLRDLREAASLQLTKDELGRVVFAKTDENSPSDEQVDSLPSCTQPNLQANRQPSNTMTSLPLSETFHPEALSSATISEAVKFISSPAPVDSTTSPGIVSLPSSPETECAYTFPSRPADTAG